MASSLNILLYVGYNTNTTSLEKVKVQRGFLHKNERLILNFNLLLKDPKASFSSEELAIAAACERK